MDGASRFLGRGSLVYVCHLGFLRFWVVEKCEKGDSILYSKYRQVRSDNMDYIIHLDPASLRCNPNNAVIKALESSALC